MRSTLLLFAAGLLLIASNRTATAAPIGPMCATCQGSIYELLYDPTPVATTADSRIFEITLRIDTTGYTGTAVRIDDVAFKVSPSLNGQTLLDAPGGEENWTALLGGIGAGGCQGNASNGFACATSNSTSVATLPFAGVYEWVFHAYLPLDKSPILPPYTASIKARYVDANGNKVGDLVSESILLDLKPVPEPGTALLLAFGLAGLARAGSVRR